MTTTGNSRKTLNGLSLRKLGPALIAGVAYLDPGNFASNIVSGALFNYSLLWVVLLANVLAWFVQYLAAKMAIATGESLTEVLSKRFRGKFTRIFYWLQAEVVILATEIAEVVGGAVALNILFGIPLGIGAIITAGLSMLLLSKSSKIGFFTWTIICLTVLTSVGIIASVNFSAIALDELALGLVPRIQSQSELLVTLGMLGATVMPHAIYSHSALVRDKFGTTNSLKERRSLLKITRVDVTIALGIAGFVNLCLLLVGATIFQTSDAIGDPIYDTFNQLFKNVSPMLAILFAVALLASALASSAVGAFAGGEVMGTLINKKISIWIRRSISVIPAVAIIQISTSPTEVLLLSQVILSLGLPFALIPLVYLTSNTKLMNELVNKRRTVVFGAVVCLALVGLNLKFVFDSLGISLGLS